MKERKNRLRNILAVAVTLAIVGSSVNIPSAVSFARETAGMDMEQSADNADDEGTQTAEKVVGGPDVLPDSFQLSEDQKTQSAEEQGAGQEQTQPAGSGSQTLSEGEPEGEEETEDIAEESVDLSYFLYQCGGTGVMDKPMLMSEDEGVSALSDTAGAKEAVLAAIKAWDKEVDVSAYQVTTEELTRLYVDIVNENPELFYVGGSIGYTYSPSSMTALTAKPTYNPAYTKDSVQIYNRAFEKAYNEAVPDPDGMTRLQVARACHDYLAQHMCYDESLQKYDAYNAFVEGTAVCQGYSLAYAAMMKKAGIPFGYAVSEEMEHEWNQIKLDGQWYHVDVTWDDPGNSVGYVRYLYFLNSDAKIRGEHEGWVGQTCSSEAYDHAYWQESRVVSAIFAIGNKEYYIICEDNPDIADTKDAWLVCRQVDGTETKLVSVDTIREAGGGLFYMGCYSSLSHYNGKLYYNGAKDIYSVNPSASSVADSKKTVYTYDGAGYLYASFVCGDKIQMLVSSNPNLTDGTVKEVELPAGAIKGVTVVAEPSSIEYGYTAAPKMKAEVTLRDGETGTPEFKWYRITEDGREELISGQTTDTCPADMGLSIGTHTYCVKVTLGDDVVEREVSLTVTGKEQQTGFKFVAASENRTYGEADFVAAVTGNAKGSKVTYRIEDPSVASIDETGKVHIKKAGTTRIIAVASATSAYEEAVISCELQIKKATLSWTELDGLYAADRADNETGDRKRTADATLYGKLKVAGIVKGDDVIFDCPADKLVGTYVNVMAGAQDVRLSWRGAPVTLTGADADNYVLPGSLPTVKGRITKIIIQDVDIESEDGTQFRLEIETGITKVAASLESVEKWNTVLKINKGMKAVLTEIQKSIADENKVVYDVKLMVNIDGKGWVEATEENFPKDGLTVTIPYPEGTGKDTHNFVAAHLFTVEMNGYKAGDIEQIKTSAITKADKGIQFVIHGLSPISIGWEEIDKPAAGGSTEPNGQNGKTTSPKTGDENGVWMYGVLMLVSAAYIGYIWRRRRLGRLSCR